MDADDVEAALAGRGQQGRGRRDALPVEREAVAAVAAHEDGVRAEEAGGGAEGEAFAGLDGAVAKAGLRRGGA